MSEFIRISNYMSQSYDNHIFSAQTHRQLTTHHPAFGLAFNFAAKVDMTGYTVPVGKTAKPSSQELPVESAEPACQMRSPVSPEFKTWFHHPV